ncbi:unnamed protein product, partial [Allacma fusca]
CQVHRVEVTLSHDISVVAGMFVVNVNGGGLCTRDRVCTHGEGYYQYYYRRENVNLWLSP